MASRKNNQLNLGLGVNLDEFKKGFADAIKATKGSTAAIEQEAKDMAAAVVQAMKKVEGASTLKQASRALDNMVGTMHAFGLEGTKAFNEVARQAGNMKAQMDDVQGLIAASRPDAPFHALATTLTAGTQAFAGLQGAMALFGTESEEVQKVLVKIQAAMALAEGAKAIDGLVDGFKQISLVVKTNLIPALGTLKGAIIATGIGALVITAGVLASKFLDTANAVEEARKAVDELAGTLDVLNETEDQQIDKQIAMLRAVEGTEEKIFELEQQKLKNRRNHLDQLSKDYSKSEEERNAFAWKSIRLTNQIEIVRLNHEADNAIKERALKKANQEQMLKDREEYLKNLSKMNAGKMGPEQDKSDLQGVGIKALSLTKSDDDKKNEYALYGLRDGYLELTDAAKAYTEQQMAVIKANREIQITSQALTDVLQNSTAGAIADLSAAFGDAVATGADMADALGQTFINAMSGFMKAFGQMLIKAGVARMVMDKALIVPGGGPAAIAAGAALIATASGISALLKKGMKAEGFASGGLIPGNSRVGDRLLAPVNSGEVVLNTGQQNELLRLANGKGGSAQPVWRTLVTSREIKIMLDQHEKDYSR